MAIEIERKFKLISGESILAANKSFAIYQAYLFVNKTSNLRIRLDNKEGQFIATLCYKQVVNDTTRNEYEYNIPLVDAIELYNSSKHRITKRRISMCYSIFHIDIDIFSNGTQVVEVEYSNNENFGTNYLPYFCGEEVTNDSKYSNIALAKSSKANLIPLTLQLLQ